jgi:hypothetical protein
LESAEGHARRHTGAPPVGHAALARTQAGQILVFDPENAYKREPPERKDEGGDLGELDQEFIRAIEDAIAKTHADPTGATDLTANALPVGSGLLGLRR